MDALPRLLYFQKKNTFSGDHNGMRMRVKMITPEEGEKHLQAWVWPEPLSFDAYNRQVKEASDKSSEPEMFTAGFPLSDAGQKAACEWITQQYLEHQSIWEKYDHIVKE